jgi:hypothetical protein
MRTKTLLLAAVLSAAGVASSLAQVYSVNAVGYINLNLPAGFAMIANQLNASPNNNLSTILPNLTIGSTVYKFNETTATFDSFLSLGAGAGWLPDTTLAPGEGAFLQLAAATTVTLVGEVPQGTALTVSMPAGLSIRSSIVPQSLGLGALGLQLATGDTVYRFNRATQSYDSYLSLGGASGWLPSDPTPEVGESFWVQRAAAGTWTRSFSVNN